MHAGQATWEKACLFCYEIQLINESCKSQTKQKITTSDTCPGTRSSIGSSTRSGIRSCWN